MEESKEKDRSSKGSKGKEAFLDLDFGKDFLTSWKSISIGEGNGLDFDLTPVPKGNKKSFNLENEDMDFNLDGDFGKISSFNMDMPDLDISPPLKKDGKANDKAKESSSFNMDMSDLDLSSPLKKNGKANEKGKESTSGNDKRKTDRFAFAFDFDELGNFDFGPSLRKEDSNAQKDKDKKERSPNKSDHQIKEVLMHKNLSRNINNIEDESRKPSRPGSVINFGMDALVGEIQDLEPTEKALPSNFAVDDASTLTVSAGTVKFASASGKAKISSESAIVPMGLPPSTEKLVSTEPVGLARETCFAKAAMQDLRSSCISGDGSIGGNSSEAHEVEFMDPSPAGSNGEQDVKLLPIAGPTCDNTMSEDSQHLQTETSEKNADEVIGSEDHVIDKRERPGLGEVNSLAETLCDSSALPGVLYDTPSTSESQKPASNILNLSLKSQQTGISEKEHVEGVEPVTTSSISYVQSDKDECASKILSTPEIISPLSNKKTGIIQPSLLDGKRGLAGTHLDRKLISLSSPSRNPGTRNQESCKDMKIIGEKCRAGGSPDVEKKNDTSTKTKALVETKTTPQEHEMSLKNPGTLSIEISKTTAQNVHPTPLGSFPITKNVPVERMRLSSFEGGKNKKVADLCGLKHSGTEIAKRAAKYSGDATPLASFPTMKHVPAQEKRLSFFEGGKKVPDLCGLKLSGVLSCSMEITEKAAQTAGDATPFLSSPTVKHIPAEEKRLSSFAGGKMDPDLYGLKLSGTEITEKSAQNAGDVTPLSSFPTMKHVLAEEKRLSSFGGGKKAPDVCGLKLSSLNVGPAKSPIQKDIKSAGGICQSKILPRKTLLDTTPFPDSKKQIPTILPIKRKTLAVDAAAVISLHPSKRCFQPPIVSRNFTGESERVLEEKASNHSKVEGDTFEDHSEAAIFHHNEKIKGLEISFSVENHCHIKLVEAYGKKLDDLCNLLRKKNDEAKEILVQATVNSNKLLLLYSPLFKQKFAQLRKVWQGYHLTALVDEYDDLQVNHGSSVLQPIICRRHDHHFGFFCNKFMKILWQPFASFHPATNNIWLLIVNKLTY